jgi:hypothetical protein
MIPSRENLYIQQGDTLNQAYQLKDNDDNIITLTGFSGTCEIRKVSDSTLIDSPSITVDASNGIFYIQLTAVETAALTPGDDALEFDVKLTKSSDVFTPVHGSAVIYPEVTAS